MQKPSSSSVENGPGRVKPRTLRGQKGGADGALAKGQRRWGNLMAKEVSGERPPRLT